MLNLPSFFEFLRMRAKAPREGQTTPDGRVDSGFMPDGTPWRRVGSTVTYGGGGGEVAEGTVVFKGNWDASSGSFPAGAEQGWLYRVSVAGTTGGQAFTVGDLLKAIGDTPSTSVYADNWLRIDSTMTQSEWDALLSATTSISTFIKTILNDADAPTARATLGLDDATNEEVALGEQTALRSYSPAQLKMAAETHGGIGGSTGSTANAALVADGTGGSTAKASGCTIPDLATGALGIVRQTFANAAVTVTAGTNVLAQTGTMSGARIVTLPAASGYAAGDRLLIVDESGTVTNTNRINFAAAGGDATNAVSIHIARGFALLESDGSTRWNQVGGNALPAIGSANIGNGGGGNVTGTIGGASEYFSSAHIWTITDTAHNTQGVYNAGTTDLASGSKINWSSTTNQYATKDTGLARAGAGVLSVTDGSTGGGIVQFPQVSSLGSPSSNSARIGAIDVSGTAEVHVCDEAGNVTQISAHTGSAPDWMYRGGEPDHSEAIGVSWNNYTGVVTYQHRETGAIHRETFEEHNERLGLTGERALVIQDWDTVQAAQVAAREDERAEWQAKRAAWEALPEAERPAWSHGDQPVALVAKPRPPGLTDQRAAILAGRARESARAALRESWAAQPAWIRGPFHEKFQAAQSLLDTGDDDAAEALIRYAEEPSSYSATYDDSGKTVDQVAVFHTLRADLANKIKALPK